MEIIRNYLEMSFASLPKTPELFRLKEEMAANMEDKYNALKAEGKSENEAVGIVIAEFGNIEEIARELGIPMPLPQAEAPSLREVTMSDAEQYIQAKQSASNIIGVGVLLCILGAAVLVGTTMFVSFLEIAPLIGVVLLLLMVAVAVGLFIFADSKTKPWEYIEKSPFMASLAVNIDIRRRQEYERPRVTLFTIIAVIMYILGPVVIILSASLVELANLPETLVLFGVILLLCMVAVATMILIISTAKNSAYDALLQKEEYSPEGKKAGTIVGAIATFWWPVATGIFLALGFLAPGGFGIAWVVWPVSGVLFGGVSAIAYAIVKNNSI